MSKRAYTSRKTEVSRRSDYSRAKRRNYGKQAQMIRKMAGEKKGMDTDLDAITDIIATTNTNADGYVLNLVRQGSGSWQRDGKKIYCKSLRLTLNLRYINAATGTPQVLGATLRIVVVWDSQPSGVLPTFDTIFGRTVQDGTEETNYNDAIRYDNMDRFKILSDDYIDQNPMILQTTNTAANIYNRHYDKYIKLGNRTTIFSGQSTPMTIADISSGGLYVYFRTSAYLDGTEEWNVFTGTARLRYSD